MDASFFQHAKQVTKFIVTILSWTLFAILLLVIAFLAYYLIATNIYSQRGEKYEPELSLYTIVSPSMEPNIKVYDVIINKKIKNYNNIKTGDVITFISTSNISNGMTVTHRVKDVIDGPNGLEFKTKGDNNLAEDTDTAKQENVIGKVIMKIPQLGRLQFFLSNSGGWLLVVVIPALFIIVKDIMKIMKLTKAKKEVSEATIVEDNSEKLELEAFKKESIKKRLSEKELEKANNLKESIKTTKKPIEQEEITEEKIEDEVENNIENDNNQNIVEIEINEKTSEKDNEKIQEEELNDLNNKIDNILVNMEKNKNNNEKPYYMNNNNNKNNNNNNNNEYYYDKKKKKRYKKKKSNKK